MELFLPQRPQNNEECVAAFANLVSIYVNVAGCLFDICLHLQAFSWEQERLLGSVSKRINPSGCDC